MHYFPLFVLKLPKGIIYEVYVTREGEVKAYFMVQIGSFGVKGFSLRKDWKKRIKIQHFLNEGLK